MNFTPRATAASPTTRPRCWNVEGFLPFRLEVLTPVFIGSGEELSPLEYVIRKESGGHVLHLVDAAAWLCAEGADSDISAALNGGEMLKLRRLMAERLDVGRYSLGRAPIPSEELAKALYRHITNPDSRSKAEVMPLLRNPVTCTAIVPGSSLKGAVSTPLIDSFDILLDKTGRENLKKATQHQPSGYQDTLKRFFGGISEHAMQALKVADIAVPPEGTAICEARELRLNPGTAGTPKPPCETVRPSGKGRLALYGSLHLDCRSGRPAIGLPGGAVLEWREIVKRCNAFYTQRFRREWNTFYTRPQFAQTREALLPVRQRLEALDPETDLLLRVGHYSHIECVTVSNNAPRCAKGFGKTRTLADGLLPFGWVILHFCPQDEYAAGVKAVDEAIAAARRQRERVRAEQEARHAALVEQQQRKAAAAACVREQVEAEKRKREEKAALRAAELAHLSPQERTIAALGLPDATEKESMDLFLQLDTLDAPLRRQAAVALKTYWSEHGKWSGKQSEKQKKKIARVKEILAE